MLKESIFGEEVSQKIALLGLSPLDGRYDSTGDVCFVKESSILNSLLLSNLNFI